MKSRVVAKIPEFKDLTNTIGDVEVKDSVLVLLTSLELLSEPYFTQDACPNIGYAWSKINASRNSAAKLIGKNILDSIKTLLTLESKPAAPIVSSVFFQSNSSVMNDTVDPSHPTVTHDIAKIPSFQL